MSREPWYEDDNPDRVARAVGGRFILWLIVFVVVFGLIGVGIWAFSVGTAPVKGRGDAFRQKESGTNRIASQERFEQLYQDVLASDRRIDTFAASLKRNPDSVVAQTNYDGAITHCQNVVADYDAASRKYTSADFRAIDLPAQIDNQDPTTDCKETTR